MHDNRDEMTTEEIEILYVAEAFAYAALTPDTRVMMIDGAAVMITGAATNEQAAQFAAHAAHCDVEKACGMITGFDGKHLTTFTKAEHAENIKQAGDAELGGRVRQVRDAMVAARHGPFDNLPGETG